MVLPAFSGRLASWIAAHTAAPAEMPTSIPSVRADLLTGGKGVLIFDRDDLVIDLRYPASRGQSQRRCPESYADPAHAPLDRTGELVRLHCHDLDGRDSCSFRYSPTPVTVPPVPTPATKIVHRAVRICPDLRAGGGIVRGGIGRVHKLAGQKAVQGCPAASSSALAMAPFMPLAPSVSTSSAP